MAAGLEGVEWRVLVVWGAGGEEVRGDGNGDVLLFSVQCGDGERWRSGKRHFAGRGTERGSKGFGKT